jgi:ribonuclease P protein component
MRGGTRAKVPAQQKMTPSGLRIGFTVGRALGGAVERNRMKRRLREAVRIKRPLGGVAADVVINPKKAILATAFADVVKEVEKAFGVIEQRLAKELAREESKGSATKA